MYSNFFCAPCQGFKNTGGASAVGSNVAKIKAEAEKLDLMDKAAGIMGELLFTEQMISEISEYRIMLLHVSGEWGWFVSVYIMWFGIRSYITWYMYKLWLKIHFESDFM